MIIAKSIRFVVFAMLFVAYHGLSCQGFISPNAAVIGDKMISSNQAIGSGSTAKFNSIHFRRISPVPKSLIGPLRVIQDPSSEEASATNVPTRRSTPFDSPVLAVVDLVTLIVFAAVGKASHTSSESVLQDIQAILVTAGPFIASWFLLSPLTGVYETVKPRDDGNLLQPAFVQTVKGWIVAIPVGCALRGVIRGYAPPIPFVIVTVIATLVLLGAARSVYAIVRNMKPTD